MGIVAWIVVGLIAGFLAKMAVPGDEPGGFLATMIIGIVGAMVGGWIWNIAFNSAGATGIDLRSIFVAFIGSVVFLVVWKAIAGRSRV